MQLYIIRRVLAAIPAIFAITVIIFLSMRILPGDPLNVLFGEEGGVAISDLDRQKLMDSLGLGSNYFQQYWMWMKDIATLKLGESFWRGDSIMDALKRRGPISGEIAIMAVFFSWAIGLPVGILAAVKQNTVPDYIARFFSILFLAIPNFWLASLIALYFLLVHSYKAPPGIIHIWENPGQNMEIVLWPALVLGLGTSAYIARMTRSALLEVIREDYIRTARAKGLRESVVVIKHALQNAILPVVTLSGVLMGYLLGGSVTVELAFAVPGLGTTLVQAFDERDFTMIQNLVLMYGLIFVFVNLLVDLAYAWIDPRIRYS